jgi:hypothetical protein
MIRASRIEKVTREQPDMLKAGELIPHFIVRNLDGDAVSYSAVWQHRNLILAAVPAGAAFEEYVSVLADRASSFGFDTACVITHDIVGGLPYPGVVVADRWGEIVHLASAVDEARLPDVGELQEWIDYVQRRCPECEGEAK